MGALRTVWVVAISIATTACLKDQLVPCGDVLCPGDTTCVDGELCASEAQLAACEGLNDGEACTAAGTSGRCDRGVCVSPLCGNGEVDIGEACDDGNVEGGDGCSSDCSKVEMCGDAVVDAGESCDDGNSNPADGCDACASTSWGATAIAGGGLQAVNVGFALPGDVAIDNVGNVYVVDYFGYRVRKITPQGSVTTVAGTGLNGSEGDGIPATSASITPGAIAVDGLGQVYISDAGCACVRRVDGNGIIRTYVQGDGPTGIALDGLGNLYYADRNASVVRRVDVNGAVAVVAGVVGVSASDGDGGPATSAHLRAPSALALDTAGNLYIGDGDACTVRRVDGAGTISPVAGAGCGYSGDGGAATAAMIIPHYLAVDSLGRVYISGSNDATTTNRIRRVDVDGTITTIVGTGPRGFSGDGGPATAAQIYTPGGIAVSTGGTVYFSDVENYRVRRVAPDGTITTFAGTGYSGYTGEGAAATGARLEQPYAVATGPQGVVYITDTYGNTIRRVEANGVISTIAGTSHCGGAGDGGPARLASVCQPEGLLADAQGGLYIADTAGHRVRYIDANGIITTVAGTGTEGFGGDNGPATLAQLRYPQSVALDGAGNLYIADTYNQRVRRIDATGTITTFAGGGSGGIGGPAASASIGLVGAVVVDAQNRVYIADRNAAYVYRVAADGILTAYAGTGTSGYSGDGGPATGAKLAAPDDLALDSLGNLYIADWGSKHVRRVDVNGTISTFAGGGTDYYGDGGLATDAQLQGPYGVATDGTGNVYIADPDSYRVKIVKNGHIYPFAGQFDPEYTGPLGQALLADARALSLGPGLVLSAGGTSGILEGVRTGPMGWLFAVAGRNVENDETGVLARFRSRDFGDIGGVAYDAAAGRIFITETTVHRIHVITVVDPADATTWTIAPLANEDEAEGMVDGPALTAEFRHPTGLYYDASTQRLYVADTGNHVVRAIELAGGVASATVQTVVGTPAQRGFFGDGGPATSALLYAPQAITRCGAELFVADTGNNRVRRVDGAGTISTVVGVGVRASSGEGSPANTFPIDAPLAVACDAYGNLFASSTKTVRLLPADAAGVVDGTGAVHTIYGAPPRTSYPASATRCLSGLVVIDDHTVEVADSCSGLLVELRRE